MKKQTKKQTKNQKKYTDLAAGAMLAGLVLGKDTCSEL